MEWIKCSDRLPPEEMICLVCCSSSVSLIDCSAFINGRFSGFAPDDVTHWMPLPEPPTE
ncbi:DUF551 domain-containing protein [Pantoea vagans]|uniref:DUF551 domain-containing protein n=1 Tax=Pantoea vagans TaxID=470934 RepID=UPI00351185EF